MSKKIEFNINNIGLNEIGKTLNPTIEDTSENVRNNYMNEWNTNVTYPIYTPEIDSSDIIKLFIKNEEESFFIRLGTLLGFINDKIIPKIESTSQPLITIDTDEKTNICYVIDNIISNDIRKVIIKNDRFYNGTETEDFLFTGLNDFIVEEYDSSTLYGQIMNIYINFNEVLTLFDNVDEKNEINLFEILSSICKMINQCLGNVNNLEPIIDEENITVKIIDQTPIPNIDLIVKKLNPQYLQPEDNKEVILQLYGYNNNKSNFIRNINLVTEISKNYSTMISIGATSNGAIPGAESTAFSKWNVGLTDRFKTQIIDANANTGSLEDQNSVVINNYIDFIAQTFLKIGLNQSPPFEVNTEVVDTNTTVIENFYKYAQAQSSKNEENSIESSVGFLPFNLKIEMDGIGGIKIYNRVKTDTRFLPSNYPDTLQFIITGVNHKISDNDWVTSLETIATIDNNQGKKNISVKEILKNYSTQIAIIQQRQALEARNQSTRRQDSYNNSDCSEDSKIPLSDNYNLAQLSCNTDYAKYSLPKIKKTGNSYYDPSREEIIQNLTQLAKNILEPLRKNYLINNENDISITAGYRNQGKISQHEIGQAVDIQFYSIRKQSISDQNRLMLERAKEIEKLLFPNYDDFILEYKIIGTQQPWIHISYRTNPSPRKQKRTAITYGDPQKPTVEYFAGFLSFEDAKKKMSKNK
jgi:hypothetical protein